MLISLHAQTDADGRLRIVESVNLPQGKKAIVTILDENDQWNVAALLIESALAADWSRPEEDQAWAHLRPEK